VLYRVCVCVCMCVCVCVFVCVCVCVCVCLWYFAFLFFDLSANSCMFELLNPGEPTYELLNDLKQTFVHRCSDDMVKYALYARKSDPARFSTAVRLLNQDIVLLMSDIGVKRVHDPEYTLENLQDLLRTFVS
jgi:hypothetical protein